MESSSATSQAPSTPVNGRAPGTSSGGSTWDAIVVGGGHNGLTTGAYLAKAGLKTLILERRHILGGACVTEEVWPGARVSRASYVVSMLQPKVVADLELKRYGYEAYPLDPAYAAMTPDGPIIFHDDVVKTQESIARFSKKDAEAYGKFEELLFMAADFVRPMMIRQPPGLGSKAPADVAGILREAGRIAGMSQRDVQQLVRIFTMSVGDWLDSMFENDYLKGSLASTGVVGVWAGPYSPGTAYNLLHHALGELDGAIGAWGQVIGGMGAISEAIASSARASGAEIRTDSEVVSIDSSGGRVTGVTLADGSVHRAPIVASGAHPKTTIMDLAGAQNFPDEVGEDMAAYRTRGASVKINMVLSEAPVYEGLTEEESKHLLTAGVNYCPSLLYLEQAWQDAVRGVPAENPYVEMEVPSSIDPSLTDDDRWIATMFTQYGPTRARPVARGLAREVRRHLHREHRQVRDEPARLHPRARGPRPARPRGHLRPRRRLDLPGRAGHRPDGLHAPLPHARPVRHPDERPISVRRRHPPGRRRDGGERPQRRPADPQGPQASRVPQAPQPREDGVASKGFTGATGLRRLVTLDPWIAC